MPSKKSNKVSGDEELLKIARQRFDLAAEAYSDVRRLANEDAKFAAGEQWPLEVKSARDQDRRPCLTINRLPQLIRQITNDQRQNRPAIKVSPIDQAADVETAKILQGIIRHIEYSSNADTAYDTAFDSAVRRGFGYFRIITDYCDPQSFEQEIKIKRIRNPMTVYLDPSSQEPDGSDCNWGFIFDEIPREEFESQYPDAEMSSMEDWSSIGHVTSDWASKDAIRIAEYFYKDFKEVTLVQLNTKQVLAKEDLPEELPEGVEIVSERKSLIPTIKWCKLNATEVLEKTDWPGKWIPIIPVLGEELDIDGKRVLESLIRHAKDSQRMYNYWASSETETIALAPRAPFIGVEGQFEGHEAQWKTANQKNHAYLEYKSKSIGGEPAPAPTRNVYEPPVQAITGARSLASEDIKATTGIYDAALGNRSNENSGIAIQRRSAQTQTSNFHFVDNLTKSIRHAGRILVDLIPQIYDTDRAIRILGEDDSEEIVFINKLFERNGKPVSYNLAAGTYDVAVNTGPSYQTKRQEAVSSMADMTKSFPELMKVAGDLMVKNMDWPGAQDIAERIKKTLPPNLIEDKSKPQPLPPQVQQQMQQMDQMIHALTSQLNHANHTIETKTIELESKERIAMAQIQAEIEIAAAKMGSVEAIHAFKSEVDNLNGRLELLKFSQPIDSQNGSGPQPAAQPPVQQPPTGGQQTPGQPMEGQQP